MVNIRSVSRLVDDLPPTASDQELVEWGQQLLYGPQRPNRPLVAERETITPEVPEDYLSIEELFADIAERAASVHTRTRIRIRQ